MASGSSSLPASDAVEPLLRFKKAFDFQKFVQDHLVPPKNNDLAKTVLSTARLIGQEKDGGVLFVWDTASPSEGGDAAGEIVTHVGWYSQTSPRYRVLYRHETRANICAATVNFERTLLAFTVQSTVGNEVTYEPFVAEIQPQSRVFTLNMNGSEFRRLQFLNLDMTTPKNRISRNILSSRLLLVIPDVYACLYTFKMQMLREGAVLTQQPEQEVIADNFSWYQWDPLLQRLYYASFESTYSPAQASVSGRNSLVLHCIGFSSSSHQLLLSVSLPLPYNERVYSSSSTYYRSPFAFTVPVREMNLQVLHRRDGFWCVCLQHCTGVASVVDDANFEYEDPDTPQGGKIDYSVYIIHNGYVLYGQVPLPIPSSEDLYIHFMLIGCFVAAYIPGFMLHLLNVGPRTDPCHHLAFGPDLTPDFPILELTDTEEDEGVMSSFSEGPILSTAISTVLLGDYNTALMECCSEVIYECGLNVASFLALFRQTSNYDLRESLLHLMVMGFRHHAMALSMIEFICQTPMTLADHRLFAEFMLSSAFANVFYDCKRYMAKQLPLTISPTFRGKVYKNKDGSKLALLKVSPMQNFLKQLLIQCDQKLVSSIPDDLLSHQPPTEHPLEMLCYTVITSQPQITRIDFRSVMAKQVEGNPSHLDSLKLSQSGRQSKNPSLQEFTASTRGLRSYLTTLTRRTLSGRHTLLHSRGDLMDTLKFLEPDEHESVLVADEVNSIRDQTLELIGRSINLRSRNIVYTSLMTHLNELEKQSCMLLLLIWQSLSFNMETHPLRETIHRRAIVKEQILFELLEGYRLAHMEIGIPVPAGFHTLFTSLGYICLDSVLFLQYLRNGIFVTTKRFADLLLSAPESTSEAVMYQIVAQMDFQLAEYTLGRWKSPVVEQLQAVHLQSS